MLRFSVSDTGIGIKNEDLSKLFGSFQRLEEEKNRNIEGTGLGLNITMRLVKMMDGSIGVSSNYGEGTTFTANMKQTVIDETPVGDFAENILKLQEQTEGYKPALIAPNARVLIVDDNDMNLDVIAGLLEDTKIKVTTADSGQECLDILKDNSFDVIFLDQMMPGMSGVQTLTKIKEDKLAKETPIIALTADAIVGARENYIKEGFTDYLSKPVMNDDLEQILLKYLKPELLQKEEEKPAAADTSSLSEDGEKPLVIAISESSEKLKTLKSILGSGVKGVFVKDRESAAKYLEKNK